MDLKAYLQEKRERVDRTLDTLLPREKDYPETLHSAMRYSLFAGGKRVRPILALAASEAVKGREEDVLPFAAALELVHTYSLIHDDLPAMDNDDMRRGKATNHKVFGEAIAILAGDALLTHAFKLLSDPGFASPSQEKRLQMIYEAATASGCMGMVGGQAVDILSEGRKEIDLPTLEYIHTHKTGAMIRASVRIGGIAGGADEVQMEDLSDYGERIGLAFQVADDLLDILGDEEAIGKHVGSDLKNEKKTYPAIFGIQESKKRAWELMEAAVDSLSRFDHRADRLREMARFVVERIQ